MCVCISVCLCCPVCRQRPWRRTDPPFKESYQMSKGSISKKEKSDALKRHKENEKEEDIYIYIMTMMHVIS
jgi:hypothetical protein